MEIILRSTNSRRVHESGPDGLIFVDAFEKKQHYANLTPCKQLTI